ncbi:MAG: hypothetical protein R3A10_00395 [Caldilineaceae bacterium]
MTVSPKHSTAPATGIHPGLGLGSAGKQPSASAYQPELVAGAGPQRIPGAGSGRAQWQGRRPQRIRSLLDHKLQAPHRARWGAQAAATVPPSIGDSARAIVIERSYATVTSDQVEDMKSAAKRLVDAQNAPPARLVAITTFRRQCPGHQTAADARLAGLRRDGVKAAIDTISLGDDAAALGVP